MKLCKRKTVYVVRHWLNDKDYIDDEFDILKAAIDFANKKYKEFEILRYDEVIYRYYTKLQLEEYEQ